MTTNVGSADKIIRVLIGLAILAFAFFGIGYPYHWLGYIGILPLLTAAFGTCPLYSVFGVSTCTMKRV